MFGLPLAFDEVGLFFKKLNRILMNFFQDQQEQQQNAQDLDIANHKKIYPNLQEEVADLDSDSKMDKFIGKWQFVEEDGGDWFAYQSQFGCGFLYLLNIHTIGKLILLFFIL